MWPKAGVHFTAGLVIYLLLCLALEVDAIGCFQCTSVNKGNAACEDSFNNTDDKYYISDCWASRNGRHGLFPATECIKMIASDGYPSCPVASFEKFLTKLHPECDRLWQRPKESFIDDEPWYCKSPIGEKKLKTFMSDLSVSCGLSVVYTNHSIRATGATILSKSSFSAAQIMSVTGHKSVQSLSVYQKVDNDEKVKMGMSIAQSLQPKSGLALPPPFVRPALPAPPVQTALAPQTPATGNSQELKECDPSDLANFNIDELFNDFGPVTNNSVQVQRTNHPQMFHNCSVTIIQNLTINK